MKEMKGLLFLAVLVLVGTLFLNSVSVSANEDHGRGKSVAVAREALEQGLLPLVGAGVVGIAHSEAEGQIIVFVENEKAKETVPRFFEGCSVRTEVIGRIQALSTQLAEPATAVSQDRQCEVRPLVGGTSLSAYVPDLYYAATLGMVTYDNKMLSNAHVIAMAPRTDEFLNTGTPIIQPGSADGGRLRNRVGELESYLPIDFGPQARNYADAAVGSIDEGIGVSPGEQFGEGGNYWIEGWVEVSNGDILRKSGSATGVTTGKVIHTNASLWVVYGGQAAYFVDQILVEQDNWSFAAPDDSGSAVDKDGEFVGLVFAGSDTLVAINKAGHIIEELGIAVEPVDGQYSLTVSSTPGGSVVTPGEGMFIYNDETVVDLVAEPDQHYRFVEWTWDVSTIADVIAADTTIAMNSSYSITASFEPVYPESMAVLALSSTTGGSIISPDEDTSLHAVGTDVSLVAEPDEGYQFTNWSGDVDAVSDVDASSTTITMESSYSIRANFSGGARCFIATAAYGTPMAEEIQVLRQFRDRYLLTNPMGKAFVDLYYSTSPPIAEFIDEHPDLKPIVRIGLVPIVAVSTLVISSTLAEKITIAGLLALVLVAGIVWVIRRRGEGSYRT
ncbi:MAG: CFI-box-CTERM domain-containing protein [Dehalococcoidia bacterium]